MVQEAAIAHLKRVAVTLMSAHEPDLMATDLTRVLMRQLVAQREMRDQLYPDCQFVFSRYGKRILNFYAAWSEASKRAGLVDEDGSPKMLFHDLRRTGVRNLIRAGVPERVAMAISGHKTRAVLDRYNIVDERDIRRAGESLDFYLREQSKHKSSTNKAFQVETSPSKEAFQNERKLLN
jgi:hypothetical protein